MLLELVAVALATIHFGVPLVYYWYLKARWLNKPWNIEVDPNYKPEVSIIIPTYNEAELIEKKLDNIYEQDYPRDRVEIVVVDSASTDGTPEKVRDWSRRHPDLRLVLLEEPIRRGMVPALNYALKNVSSGTGIVVFTDVDAFLPRDGLRQIVKYFADEKVGAVTTCIYPLEKSDGRDLEETYRDYYNVVRIGESKIHSTPIHNGALIAFRKKLLEALGGLPTYTGNDDSTPASLMAFMGYRAIQIDDVVVCEPVRGNYMKRKIRRAQHLILHFIYTKRYAKNLGVYQRTDFDKIWRIEAFLHLANPWLLLASTALLLALSIMKSLIAIALLSLGIAMLLLYKPFRTWILNQLYLAIASIRNLWTKEIIWSK